VALAGRWLVTDVTAIRSALLAGTRVRILAVVAFCGLMYLWLYVLATYTNFSDVDKEAPPAGVIALLVAAPVVLHFLTGFAVGRGLALLLFLVPAFEAIPFDEGDAWIAFSTGVLVMELVIGFPLLGLGFLIRRRKDFWQ
jgi:hypothetical protein